MKLCHNTNMCDICGKPRSRGIDHSVCSKKRQKQGFAERRLSERERISESKRVARRYTDGKFKMPD